MKVVMHLGDKPVVLVFKDFDDEVDVDQLTSIDHSNLYGEAVTVPALMNHVGILKASAEKIHSEKKMELEIFEAKLRQITRKDAVVSGEKLTEASLNEKVEEDKVLQDKRRQLINAKYNFDITDSLFWSISAKDKKLNNLIKGVTPQELYQELQEGVINNILIKKHKSITEK